ncbi:uncharacterized protein LOC109847458 [Asparagus officinalis]|uniref:uncharacterized protein LOC109847458 n=1 Tax=Asparagus officinalis TaxID=4686 RepID=UPI00098E60F4|nr:uncharacterized protein LOC109847458 [Asparagus officinalis]
MYNLRKGSKTSRLKGIEEFLSIENQSIGQEEELTAEPVPEGEQRVVDPPMTRAVGKRKFSADEAGKYDKQIRRKLLVDSPPKGQQKSKLMAEAIKAARDDEPQESSVAGLPHRAGLRSHGPALSGEAAGASLPESSAVQDDEERVDYDDSPAGDAADGNRGNEDADVGNMSGSPTPGTTSAAPLEQEPAQVLAPPQEPHLSGSPMATVSPVALPETTATTSPLEQAVVQVSTPLQGQTLQDSSVVATSPKAVMKISLTPTEAGPSSSQVKALMALTSSTSQLNISIASAASAPGSPASHHLNASISAAEGVSSGAIVSLANAPKFLQISLVYLNSLAKTVVESLMNGQGTLNSFRPLLEAGLNGVRSVGETQWFERCSEIILRLEEKLQCLKTMGHSDLQPQIMSTLASLQVAEVIHRETLEQNLAEKERQIAELRERNIRKREELERSTASMNLLRDKLVEAEAEVLRLKAELSREEDVVNILSTQNTTGTLEYHTQAQALEDARKEVAAIIIPSEDELRAKAEAMVRANHEAELAELKAQLISFDLMHE